MARFSLASWPHSNPAPDFKHFNFGVEYVWSNDRFSISRSVVRQTPVPRCHHVYIYPTAQAQQILEFALNSQVPIIAGLEIDGSDVKTWDLGSLGLLI